MLVIPSLALFITRYRNIPFIAKEENTYSREFWMFIGMLVLVLGSMHILFYTSMPVWNKIFGTSKAPPALGRQ